MNRLEIVSIEGKGDLANECIWFDVKEQNVSLHHYLVSDTTFTDANHVSNELRHVFWFPQIAVARGDYIKLMTKTGVRNTTGNARGTTTHLLYWGLGRTVWNKDGDCAVLFKLENWQTRRA